MMTDRVRPGQRHSARTGLWTGVSTSIADRIGQHGGRREWHKVIVAFAVLATANAITFFPHYRGHVTFPWDFLGGYHAQAFGWYDAGSILDPPQWFPWADLGFPAELAVQSGGWYLPLVILDGLGITYTIYVATVVQSAHVLFAALGAFLLLRALGLPWIVSLLGAIGYHFSSGFFSNQQHVDILRAGALLPWLLWSLHPGRIMASAFGPIVFSVFLFQFLVAAYPGNIVAAFYTCLAFCAVMAWTMRAEPRRAIQYGLVVMLAAAAGALLGGVKWLPFILSGDLSATAVRPPRPTAIVPQILLTLGLPHDVPFLPRDLTMRSLWFPTVLLAGAMFARRSPLIAISIAFIGLALVLGSIFPLLFPYAAIVPGLNISRFPISDWRPVLQIGLLVAAVSGWKTILLERPEWTWVARRTTIGLLVGAGVLWIGLGMAYPGQGYSGDALLHFAFVWCLSFAIASAVAVTIQRRPLDQGAVAHVAMIVIILVATTDALTFYHSQSRTWWANWSPAIERVQYGGLIAERLRTSAERRRRPERLVIGTAPADVIRFRNSSRYNKCWYHHEFCLLGYNNLKMSHPHRTMLTFMHDPSSGPDVIEFARRPQQLVILPVNAPFDSRLVRSSDGKAESLSLVSGASGTPTGYAATRVSYSITAPTPVKVVENEIWFSGWRASLCSDSGCQQARTAPTKEFFRSWEVPAGQWRVELTFASKGRLWGWLSLVSGLVLAPFAPLCLRKYPFPKPLGKSNP